MILKLSHPLYFMRHTNFTRIPHKHTVPAASAATGYLRGISGAWSLLPETCYVGCSRRGAQRAESCSLVARLWKSSSRAPGSLEFHEICNPVIYYLSKDFYVRAHTHTCTLGQNRGWRNSRRSLAEGLALPHKQTLEPFSGITFN